MKIKRIAYGLLGLWLGLCSSVAAGVAPDQVIRDTSAQLLDEFSANRPALEEDPAKLFAMVREIVVPHFDVRRMSRLVLGRHWRTATPEQQVRFATEFQDLLVRTYATALFEYTGQERLSVRPVSVGEEDRQTVVQTELALPQGPPVAINYAFLNTGGEWKIFDVLIDGVSLVTNYRVSYGQVIQSQGIDALIEDLAERNREREG